MDLGLKKGAGGYLLDWGAGPRRGAVGRGGVGIKTAEGDGVTPAGAWPFRRVLYRADKMDAPKSILPAIPIDEEDGWCDAPNDVNYNKLVQRPYPSHAESLWRDDGLYDVVAVVGYNDSPIVKGKGSAIFLHVATPDYAPTNGCIALKKEDLLEALAQLKRGEKLIVTP